MQSHRAQLIGAERQRPVDKAIDRKPPAPTVPRRDRACDAVEVEAVARAQLAERSLEPRAHRRGHTAPESQQRRAAGQPSEEEPAAYRLAHASRRRPRMYRPAGLLSAAHSPSDTRTSPFALTVRIQPRNPIGPNRVYAVINNS